jgi:hypothetical protein
MTIASPPTDVPLKDRDYTLIIAKTATEQPIRPPGFAERWEKAHAAVLSLALLCETLDPDGITLYVSCRDQDENCIFRYYDHVTSTNLIEIIEENYPPHQLHLDTVLQTALDRYFERKASGKTKTNGEMILVLLDGEPSDRLSITKTIIEATHKMERDEELAIGLVQVGEDYMARGFFQALDENLQSAGAKFDIVYSQVLDAIEPDCLTAFLLHVIQS